MNLQIGSPRKNAPHEREAVSLRREVSSVRGQSLFEVILSLAIATLIITALVSLAANAVRNSNYSKNKSLATRYAQEATEWLRGQRDSSWDLVYAKAVAAPSPLVYCLETTSWPANPEAACTNTQVIPGTIFKRDLSLETGTVGINKNIINATIRVYWADSQGMHEVRSATSFTDWRQI